MTKTLQRAQSTRRPRYGSPKLPDSFWARVGQDVATRCWLWTGGLDREGYPSSISINCLRQSPLRHAYQRLIGPFPQHLTLDHRCRVRHCVNPAHVEPVTRGENARRAKLLVKACPQGHRYEGQNIVWVGGNDGRPKRRGCRTCYNDRSRSYWHTTRKQHEKDARRAAGYRGGWEETNTCVNGHAKTPENLYTRPDGRQVCKRCLAEASARYSARQRGALEPVRPIFVIP